jgi:hypothetical protein
MAGVGVGRKCSIDGCERPYKANGLCHRHDLQTRINGRIFGNPTRSRTDKNEIKTDGVVSRIVLYDKYSFPVAETVIDTSDVERCKMYKWCLDKSGYCMGKIGGKNVRLSRFILNLAKGDPEVDHKNRVHLDNRVSNLRPCSGTQNKLNVGIKKNNTSGFKGICFDSTRKKWIARISSGNRTILCKRFSNISLAVIAYNETAKTLGEFAYQNEVG